MSNNKQNGSKVKNMGELALKALVAANANLVRERRKTGEPLLVWRDGKVCSVPASEIDISENQPKKIL